MSLIEILFSCIICVAGEGVFFPFQMNISIDMVIRGSGKEILLNKYIIFES